MHFICDAPPYTWFQIESEAEAALESRDMLHAVEKYFRQAWEEAKQSYVPPSSLHVIEQSIGRKAHIERRMPIFVTLRDGDGKAHVTGMLPPEGKDQEDFRPIIVGVENSDPYDTYRPAIRTLGQHFGLRLNRSRCYPYSRR